jgi:uncharacterized protein (TIGR04141 family)
MRITYYLVKQSIRNFDDVWREDADEEYTEVELSPDVPFDARAFVLRNRVNRPAWLAFVAPHVEEDLAALFNQTNSFVLLLRTSGRIFAVTFGHGFTALDRGALEADFGLKVTLNSVDKDRLRSLQARNVDTTAISKQFVVNRNSSLAVFDVDLYQNLLSKLEGEPDDAAFGSRVAGSDACYLTSDVTFTALADTCDELLRKFRGRRYKTHFGVVDRVRPVRDDALIRDLDAKLSAAIADQDLAALSLALPDIGSYDQIETYRVSSGRWHEEFTDLAVEPILRQYHAHRRNGDDPLNVRIEALNAQGTPVESFDVRRCAVFQTRHNRGDYVLTLGKWYGVDTDYVERVNHDLEQIELTENDYLPRIRETGENAEGRFNERVARELGCCCMDKNCAPISGESRIEVCDLFTRHRHFIHVKRGTRSATLSHLLAQGSVSARLFHLYREYRQWFRDALPRPLQNTVDPATSNSSRFTVVYAITAPADASLPSDLPFFSKVNLLFHERQIRMMGFPVKLCHVHET